MRLSEIRAHIDENDGYCKTCKKVTVYGGVEPDARGYECPECGMLTVMGMEEAAAIEMCVPIDPAGPDDLEDEDDLFE